MAKTNQDITALLEKYERFGIDLSLGRIKTVLGNLDNPQKQVPIVHVTGTNGKGSVCAYLSSVLTEAGYKVGRFISPHLVNWTERVCVNNQEISSDRLYESILEVEAACQQVQLTQFEVITAAAWLIFQQEAVDVAVIEVGLGGRLDATNVCEKALVSIITSISLEHQQRLGSTLGAIAGEKAGIIKANCPVVVGQLPQEAMTVIKAKAKELSSPIAEASPATWSQETQTSDELPWAIADNISFPLALKGEVQLHNSAVAIAAIQRLREQNFHISDSQIQAGMAKTTWPGRLQWTKWQGKSLLIDGAHNPAAARVLRDYVDSLEAPNVHWIMGMLSTKDHQEIFEILLRKGDRLSLVPVEGHSSAELDDLQEKAHKVCSDLAKIKSYSQLAGALEDLRDISSKNYTSVLCGSLYLLGQYMQVSR